MLGNSSSSSWKEETAFIISLRDNGKDQESQILAVDSGHRTPLTERLFVGLNIEKVC